MLTNTLEYKYNKCLNLAREPEVIQLVNIVFLASNACFNTFIYSAVSKEELLEAISFDNRMVL